MGREPAAAGDWRMVCMRSSWPHGGEAAEGSWAARGGVLVVVVVLVLVVVVLGVLEWHHGATCSVFAS